MENCKLVYSHINDENYSVLDGTPEDMLYGIAHLIATFVSELFNDESEMSRSDVELLHSATNEYLSHASKIILDELIKEQNELDRDEKPWLNI